MKYFGCIDQGTTSSRFIVFNDKGQIVASQQQELTQYLPNEVSFEHDPIEIWDSVKNCISKIDDEFSINVYVDFVDAVDSQKRFLLKSDIKSFSQYRLSIDDQIKSSDITLSLIHI